MALTAFYYFLAFLLFIVCLGGLQKWNVLPRQKKYRVGLIIIISLLSLLIVFVGLVQFEIIHIQDGRLISMGMLFFFLFILFATFFISWYNDKYNKKVDIGKAVVLVCLSAFGIIFLALKYISTDEKERLVNDIELKTIVTKITFDTHKPYFKDMSLADGRFLPMPESMNTTLQIGDSIYKVKGEKFYLVIHRKTNVKKQYNVAVHTRVLGKAY